MKKLPLGFIAAALLSVSAATTAAPVGYNMSWHGSNGYSLSGMFSYDDKGQHWVREDHLTSFVMDAFKNGSALGGFDGADKVSYFKFENGSDKISSWWQSWNYYGNSMGFGCRVGFCALTQNGHYVSQSKTGYGLFLKKSHIGTSPKPDVSLPEPATFGLVLAGLAAFGLRRSVRA